MFIAIAAISLTVSIVMSGIAWRLTGEERRRSRARVAMLASDVADRDLQPATARVAGDLFGVHELADSRSRFVVVLGIGGLTVAAALALLIVVSRNIRPASQPGTAMRPAASEPQSPSTTEPAPLELVALGHEVDGDRIVVRGIVRNPTAGVERDRVAVAVFLFSRDGGFLASSLASVEVPALVPGSQSGFSVTVPHANDVGRYRVSFRSDERIIAHVDRRNRGPQMQLP